MLDSEFVDLSLILLKILFHCPHPSHLNHFDFNLEVKYQEGFGLSLAMLQSQRNQLTVKPLTKRVGLCKKGTAQNILYSFFQCRCPSRDSGDHELRHRSHICHNEMSVAVVISHMYCSKKVLDDYYPLKSCFCHCLLH